MPNLERWLLPDGIEEILPPEAEKIEKLRRGLLDLLNTWGYDLVIPPMAEYLESLLTGVGHDLDLLTFKITDQLTGRMMGLSADNTQQVARMDAHSLRAEATARYCYSSPVLHTRPASIHASRSPIQIGAEMYGIRSADSDIEIISLMLSMLEKADIQAVTLDLGHVAIYRSVATALSLPDELEKSLYHLLRERSLPDLNEFVAGHIEQHSGLEHILYLSQCSGSEEMLKSARQYLSPLADDIGKHFDRLEAIAAAVTDKYPKVSINFDLAELKDYNYHSGLIFSAFVNGSGQPVAKGGRYDSTGRVFGRSRPATGFSADLKVLASLSNRKIHSNTVFAPGTRDAKLSQKISELRAQGIRVIQAMTDQDTPTQLKCNRQLAKTGNSWEIESI